MPIYNFLCNNCKNKFSEILSISEFLKKKDLTLDCESCKSGEVKVSLSPPTGRIERKKEDIVKKIEEEVREIVQKVREGDEATIEDVYGHRENPYKK